ncbi:hypothetical protein ACFZC3_10440 [Streptomyces sp. NPDC007903]
MAVVALYEFICRFDQLIGHRRIVQHEDAVVLVEEQQRVHRLTDR